MNDRAILLIGLSFITIAVFGIAYYLDTCYDETNEAGGAGNALC